MLLPAVRAVVVGTADLLLPNVCSACSDADVSAEGLCQACNVKLLSLVSLPYCPRCGATLGVNVPVRDDGCYGCPTPLPRFAAVVRLAPYAEPLRRVIQGIKYRRQAVMVRRLGRMMVEAIRTHTDGSPFDVIVPVPMHWRRRLSRGCDHSRIIARSVARGLGPPMAGELIRVRHTAPQVHLPRSRRIENVRGAFALRKLADVGGANVLLIDDVTTTGATANEAARTLLAGGALSVTLAVAAKAEPPTAYAERLM